MELKNIYQIRELLKNNVKLYAIYPFISSTGLIKRNKVLEVISFNNYKYSFDLITKCTNQFSIFRRRFSADADAYKVKEDDVIDNPNVSVFTTKEDAEVALKKAITALSYKAIERVNRELRIIERAKERLKSREEKYNSIKKEYFELSSKRFSK